MVTWRLRPRFEQAKSQCAHCFPNLVWSANSGLQWTFFWKIDGQIDQIFKMILSSKQMLRLTILSWDLSFSYFYHWKWFHNTAVSSFWWNKNWGLIGTNLPWIVWNILGLNWEGRLGVIDINWYQIHDSLAHWIQLNYGEIVIFLRNPPKLN